MSTINKDRKDFYMKTEAEALDYVKENTFTNEAGGTYKSGEHIDEAVAILDKMVSRQKTELLTVEKDTSEMRITLIASLIVIITSIGLIAYILFMVNEPSKSIIAAAIAISTLLSFKAHHLYTNFYKGAIQKQKQLRESISENSLIKVNF